MEILRLARLPVVTVLAREVRLATGFRARLFGLSRLDWEDAGGGLLIPRCSSVHTFGMRFTIDLHFLDAAGNVVLVRRNVPPRRFASCRRASAVLEIPSAQGGEIAPPSP
jgi:uncharacterized membrane protein (UPF0127 family)